MVVLSWNGGFIVSCDRKSHWQGQLFWGYEDRAGGWDRRGEKGKKDFWDHPYLPVPTHAGCILCPTEKDPKLEIRYRHKKSRERDSNERDGSEPRDEGGGRKRPVPEADLQRRAGTGTGVGAMLARGSASPHKSSPQPLVAPPSQVSGFDVWNR